MKRDEGEKFFFNGIILNLFIGVHHLHLGHFSLIRSVFIAAADPETCPRVDSAVYPGTNESHSDD